MGGQKLSTTIRVHRRDRSGAAMIELALFLPVFFMITMATVETCRVLYLRQSLTIAAYECARLGIVPGITRDVLDDQCVAVLGGRRIQGATLTTNLRTSARSNTATHWPFR